MLTFEEKLAIIEAFPELQRKNVSLGRVNFQYEESVTDKKNVVYHLHPNGNGFVYAENISGYQPDDKGMVNIRDFSKQDLRSIIQESILSLAQRPVSESAIIGFRLHKDLSLKVLSLGMRWKNVGWMLKNTN
ncbi:MAG: hypothetical protein K0S25_2310 [Bacillus sp. (in: firmicutes)]|nr:hypothetical protein [Bacillus sp. (in: firmicutes)]